MVLGIIIFFSGFVLQVVWPVFLKFLEHLIWPDLIIIIIIIIPVVLPPLIMMMASFFCLYFGNWVYKSPGYCVCVCMYVRPVHSFMNIKVVELFFLVLLIWLKRERDRETVRSTNFFLFIQVNLEWVKKNLNLIRMMMMIYSRIQTKQNKKDKIIIIIWWWWWWDVASWMNEDNQEREREIEKAWIDNSFIQII